jgi:hypothetical protein
MEDDKDGVDKPQVETLFTNHTEQQYPLYSLRLSKHKFNQA